MSSVSYGGDISRVMSFESNSLHSLVQNGHRFSKECVRFPLIIGVGKERLKPPPQSSNKLKGGLALPLHSTGYYST